MPSCPVCGTDNPDRARFCLECGQRLTDRRPDAVESRRTVTVVFSDIVGSTALGESLDPETLRIVMSRYFSSMEAVLVRHGGTVEKFIGDAIMAVFGLRTIHEDDALRAVRAALEMRDSLAALNGELLAERNVTIAIRTGVQTGEVVAGDPSARQTLVTGDAVNTAARLEQAAGTDEILVGETTWRLIRDEVVVERVPAIPAKGKADPVPAVRLLSLRPSSGAKAPSPASLLVGRAAELARLQEVFDRVVTDRRAELVTVLGPAGVGKSRLVAELLAEAAGRATVLRGRCLPYGEGITYWPLREILHEAAGIRDEDPPAEGQRKLVDLVGSIPDGSLVASRLASAIGLSAEAARREEIFWAVRRTLEHLAADRPLLLVVEDIHWAETLFLELLEQLIELSREIPLLIVCPARTELLDRQPDWGRDRPRVTTVVLEGLPGDAAAELLDSLPGGAGIPPGLRARILASAEGNPLFVTEMVGMLVEDGLLGTEERPGPLAVDADAVKVPPTIQALMAARVDGLPSSERALAQRASVVGRVFEQDALVQLTPEPARPEVTASLLALIRRELVTPEPSELSVEDAYKFRHILLRDAAYEALRKTDRADLHERFADWLERAAGDRLMELEEIVGYHLRQAHRYRTELREGGSRTDEIGYRAADHLHAAAKRARDRGDSAAAVGMYAQAESLPSRDPAERASLLLDFGLALADIGRGTDSGQRAEQALELAEAAGDHRAAASARLLRLDTRLSDGALVRFDPAIAAELDLALRDAEASRDPGALAEAWASISARSWSEARHADCDERASHGARARAAGRRSSPDAGSRAQPARSHLRQCRRPPATSSMRHETSSSEPDRTHP